MDTAMIAMSRYRLMPRRNRFKKRPPSPGDEKQSAPRAPAAPTEPAGIGWHRPGAVHCVILH